MAENPIARGLGLLANYLEREKARGQAFISLSPEAEETLGNLPSIFSRASLRAREEPAAPARPAASATPGEGESISPASAMAASEPPAGASRRDSEEERSEAWVREQLNLIFREVKQSERCRSLGTLRDTVVFATGNPMADLMFVGEAPGAEEEKQRKPFVGPAGRKLTQIIEAMGLSRDDVYISNIVKYRPKKGDGRFQGNSNRKPDLTEMEACLPFLHREIELVAPGVIVALGGTAAEGLLERGGSISQLRRETHETRGVPVVVTYHPSFLLRQESESDPRKAKEMKRLVWKDMLRAMDLAGLPVTEKQRGYFR